MAFNIQVPDFVTTRTNWYDWGVGLGLALKECEHCGQHLVFWIRFAPFTFVVCLF